MWVWKNGRSCCICCTHSETWRRWVLAVFSKIDVGVLLLGRTFWDGLSKQEERYIYDFRQLWWQHVLQAWSPAWCNASAACHKFYVKTVVVKGTCWWVSLKVCTLYCDAHWLLLLCDLLAMQLWTRTKLEQLICRLGRSDKMGITSRLLLPWQALTSYCTQYER